MTQFGRRGRLLPQVSAARRAVWAAVETSLGCAPEPTDLVLVGLSGGPDSLALAAAAAHFSRRRRLRVGAVVVDHQLQPDSAAVADRAAEQARALGLDPVEVRQVVVKSQGDGPEAAARSARYTALAQVAQTTDAHAVLLGHTASDQAETVLLGLARGSGTRSLGGMAAITDSHGFRILRPLLDLSRADTEAICAAEQVEAWLDPTNTDESLMRAKVRHTVLPFLERELGPGVADSLARSAAILGPDAQLLQTQAQDLLTAARAVVVDRDDSSESDVNRPAPAADVLSLDVLNQAPLPLVRRALAAACVEAGGEPVSFERLAALTELAGGIGEAGPIQMAGKVSVYRRRPSGSGRSGGKHPSGTHRGTLELRRSP